MEENRKKMKILSGIFLIISACITIIALFSNNIMRAYSMPDTDGMVTASGILSDLPTLIVSALLIIAAVLILRSRFTAAGVLEFVAASIIFIEMTLIVPAMFISPAELRGVYILNIAVLLIRSAAVYLFGMALCLKSRAGNILCVVSAVLGLIAAVASAAYPYLLMGTEYSTVVIIAVLTGFLLAMIPVTLEFLAKVFLGKYFAVNTRQTLGTEPVE